MRLLAFDDFLIDHVYQRLADSCSNRFGRNCFWLARQAAVGAFAMYLFYNTANAYDVFHNGGSGSTLRTVGTMTFALGVLVHLGWTFTSYRAANIYEPITRELGLNPYRLFWPSRMCPYLSIALAISLLIMIPTESYIWFYFGFALAIHATTYLTSCNLSPPPVRQTLPKTALIGASG